MNNSEELARSIYQGLLEKIRFALNENNFSAYASYFALPHLVETFDAQFSIATEEELAVIFDKTRHSLALENIRDFARHCAIARFVDDETISAGHETRLITDQMEIQNSYPALSILKYIDGGWKITSSQYAASSSKLPVNLSKLVRSTRP
ncbi:MAG: hypothetical protein V7695_14845 [Sulfitobacter sp.]